MMNSIRTREEPNCHDEKGHGKKQDQRSEKKFVPRDSVLTDLYKVNHFQTIYNIFLVMLFISFLNSVVHDYLETGTVYFGIRTVKLSFGNFYEIIQVWTLMVASTIATYFGFSLWASNHMKLTSNLAVMKILNSGFLMAFVMNQIAFIIIPAKLTMEKKLPPAASTLVLMEQARMLMKTHGFVRSNIPRVLAYKCKDEDNQGSNYPQFFKYLYFLFAPTLLYRDEYPKTAKIRWKVVFWNFAEVIMITFNIALLFEQYVIPWFEKYSHQMFEFRTAVYFTFSMMLPGVQLLLFTFYCILHSAQNCVAELLRFADRSFYKDWWNCTSYGEYYRTWNPIVHDWLYTYIYKDVYAMSHSRFFATLMTFAVSAIFHEYILTLSLGLFYPVMLMLFIGFGMTFRIVMRNNSRINGNIFVWWSLFVGQGIILSLYSMEYWARSNCPPYSDQLLDSLLPRSWICHKAISNRKL